ncbi:MAG: hypothetical protein NTZ94_03795, partial [Verrucomicrobia bacterium]|nr:hypothetical protein [Verrucomicrobiota bacterium]
GQTGSAAHADPPRVDVPLSMPSLTPTNRPNGQGITSDSGDSTSFRMDSERDLAGNWWRHACFCDVLLFFRAFVRPSFSTLPYIILSPPQPPVVSRPTSC